MGELCFIFDIDGTLADNSHRTHHLLKKPKDWDAYHAATADDLPHQHIIDVAYSLSQSRPVVFCTGRHEGLREITLNWLFENGVMILPNSANLYMRKEGDHRPDHVIKLELLAQICADGFSPIMVFDDRTSVVDAWRKAGIPCAQVAPGDF